MKKLSLFYIFFSFTVFTQSFWVEQNSGVSVSLNSVTNSNWPGAGWTCGNNGTVLRTSNYGTNWINVSGNGIPLDVQLNTISDCNGFYEYAIVAGMRGDTAIVYRTTNTGATWQIVFRQLNGKINGISLGTGPISFMAGNPVGGRWSLWMSTNNGVTWDSTGMYLPQNNGESGWNNSFLKIGTDIFFGTNNSRLYYSANQGINWLFVTIPGITNIISLDVYPGPPNQFAGYIGGVNKIMWTSNSGVNWFSDTTMPGDGNVVGLHKQPTPIDAMGQHNLIAVKGNDKIYWQSAYNTNWIHHFTAPAGNYTHVATKFFSNVWAVRDNGGITYCSCNISGISNASNEIPESFSLYQNYPNPFNPVTNIKFDIPKSGFVEITIYDLLGREITRLVNQHMQPGSYNVDWDASIYPSGVYFYKIETADFKETKRMVLIK